MNRGKSTLATVSIGGREIVWQLARNTQLKVSKVVIIVFIGFVRPQRGDLLDEVADFSSTVGA
jgi:hypothetical protein